MLLSTCCSQISLKPHEIEIQLETAVSTRAKFHICTSLLEHGQGTFGKTMSSVNAALSTTPSCLKIHVMHSIQRFARRMSTPLGKLFCKVKYSVGSTSLKIPTSPDMMQIQNSHSNRRFMQTFILLIYVNNLQWNSFPSVSEPPDLPNSLACFSFYVLLFAASNLKRRLCLY